MGVVRKTKTITHFYNKKNGDLKAEFYIRKTVKYRNISVYRERLSLAAYIIFINLKFQFFVLVVQRVYF